MSQHKLRAVALLLGVALLAAPGRAQTPASVDDGWGIPKTTPLRVPQGGQGWDSPQPGTSGAIRQVSFTDEGRTEPGAERKPETTVPAENGKASSALVVQVTGPETAAPGVPATYQILVRNAGSTPLLGVRVEQEAPEGLQVTLTEPDAVREPRRLVWQLGNLDAGAERRLKLEVVPGSVRELTIRPTATFTGSAGVRTRIPQAAAPAPSAPPVVARSPDRATANPGPALTVTQAGPEAIERGQRLVIQIRVTNVGETPLSGVMVHDQLPAAFRHPQGAQIETQVDVLAPGQTITVPLEVQAVQAGRPINEVVVWSREGQVARSRWSLAITEPTLRYQLTAPRQAALGGPVDVRIEVHNVGQAPARKLRVTLTHAEGLEITALSQGGQHDRPGRSASWQLETLPAGNQPLILVARLRGLKPGEWGYQAQASAEGVSPSSRSASVAIGVAPGAMREGTVNK